MIEAISYPGMSIILNPRVLPSMLAKINVFWDNGNITE